MKLFFVAGIFICTLVRVSQFPLARPSVPKGIIRIYKISFGVQLLQIQEKNEPVEPIHSFLCRGRELNPRRQPLQGCALPLSYRGIPKSKSLRHNNRESSFFQYILLFIGGYKTC